jgi:hypothetical protein
LNFIKTLISDQEILTSFLYRLSQLITGLILIFILPFKLSDIEQGLFFTFLSITALQVLFELGINQVIILTAANYFGRLSSSVELSLANEVGVRLQGFHRKIKKVFFWISILFFIFTLLFGFYFFSISEEVSSSHWEIPWLFLVLFTSLNLYITAQICFFEGLGKVTSINKMRIIQSLVSSLLIIFLMYTAIPLFSVMALPFVSFVTNYLWILLNSNHLNLIMPDGFQNDEAFTYPWMQEIFSLQWRVALTWISGYFVFYFFTPVIFVIYGPVAAGQFGLCFNIVRSLSTISLSWITPKLPELSKLFGEKNYNTFNANYFKYSFSSASSAFLFLSCAFFFIVLLNYIEVDFTNRFLSVPAMFLLCLIGFADIILHNLALYTRAQSIEPMFLISLLSAATVILISFIGNLYSLDILLFIRALALCAVIIPCAYIIFRKFYVRDL